MNLWGSWIQIKPLNANLLSGTFPLGFRSKMPPCMLHFSTMWSSISANAWGSFLLFSFPREQNICVTFDSRHLWFSILHFSSRNNYFGLSVHHVFLTRRFVTFCPGQTAARWLSKTTFTPTYMWWSPKWRPTFTSSLAWNAKDGKWSRRLLCKSQIIIYW
jgi:hypothetical protein